MLHEKACTQSDSQGGSTYVASQLNWPNLAADRGRSLLSTIALFQSVVESVCVCVCVWIPLESRRDVD